MPDTVTTSDVIRNCGEWAPPLFSPYRLSPFFSSLTFWAFFR